MSISGKHLFSCPLMMNTFVQIQFVAQMISLDDIKSRFVWIPSGLTVADAISKFFHISLWVDYSVLGLQDKLVWLGIIELCCLVVFLVPRTFIIGFFLLSCYWGGIIAAGLKNLSFVFFPMFMLTLFAIAAYWLDSSIFSKSHANDLKP